MSEPRTERLIAELAADLTPVKPIAGLARSLAASSATIAVVGAAVLVFYDLRPDLWHGFATNVGWAGVAIGLAFAAFGGCLGALSSVIPGREGPARLGGALAALGLVLALGIAAATTSWSQARLEHPLAQMACVLRGTVFAAVPAGVAMLLAARGWSGRPDLTVALALLGAGSAGALLVHLTCPALEPLHLLCTHVTIPFLIALSLTAVLAPAMRRWAR